MVFHWSLSDSKSPQISWNLLRILADLNNEVVWMVSTRPLISKSSGLFINPLVTAPRAPIIIGIDVTFMFHIFFNSLVRSRYLSFFSVSSILLGGQTGQQIHNFATSLSFLFDRYKVWSSSRDLVIRLYLKITEKFVHLILQEIFWVVHVPFFYMVKLQFLTQFRVDHLAHLVVSSLILFLC